MSALRWGIVSAGTVAHDFACAVSTLPEADHRVVAVAARGLENAQKFAELHGIGTFYDGYEALARDKNVDIVYIGAVTSTHYEVAMAMLDAGKHVLCEKPLCVNEGQSKALLGYARERGLFCMESIWSRFFPSYAHVRERIRRGDLGEIQRITIEQGLRISNVERIRMGRLGAGSILDLGVNTIQLALWTFQSYPKEIVVTGGVEAELKVELRFINGGVASIRTSGIQDLSNTAVIFGAHGKITLYDFWCPTELTDLDGTVRSYPLPSSKIECIQKNGEGLRFEVEECRKRVLAGDVESQTVPHGDSLAIARVQDTIRKQLGVEEVEDYVFKP
ncbi:dimeric dihydrodiol dehydrogenase [Culex quinquefasciatus]|uniref:Trans-1,2-dihydrobenzene-1,2-diol dehydrogenase n=1 Tax=Culex quinquefasciatus TaxID=7176 RepID=B0W180_CULQU|nr:dimeric dihydrodiol dehydrogenase [Culex quinquefasciatus]|eukprot:XP_001842464.1 dimeric dihydrodiol dehydrogenase [Culex quinquefasciatus]